MTGSNIDSITTIVSVVLCALINIVGFHFWRISDIAEKSGYSGAFSTFYFYWRRFYGFVGLFLYGFPIVIPQFIRSLFGGRVFADLTSFIYASLIIPAIVLIYFLFFVWLKAKKK